MIKLKSLLKEQSIDKPYLKLVNKTAPTSLDINDDWVWTWEYEIHNFVVDNYKFETIAINSELQDPSQLEDYNSFDEFMQDQSGQEPTYDLAYLYFDDANNPKPADSDAEEEYDFEGRAPSMTIYDDYDMKDKIFEVVGQLLRRQPDFKSLLPGNIFSSEEGGQGDYYLECDIIFTNRHSIDAIKQYYSTRGNMS